MEGMEAPAGKQTPVDLNKLIEDYNSWQAASADVWRENVELSQQLKSLQKQCSLHQQAAKSASEDCIQLRSTVEKLHGILVKRCNFEDENGRLKEQIATLKSSMLRLEEVHRQQVSEAIDDLKAAHDSHKRELLRTQENTANQARREKDSLERSVQEKNSEIRQLHKRLAEQERERHTETVKLRLEYDAKLLKLQKQSSRSQCVQSSSISSDIFRQKLQHARVESEREISALRKRVAELERGGPSSSKRRKF